MERDTLDGEPEFDAEILLTVHYGSSTSVLLVDSTEPSDAKVLSPAGRYGNPSLQPGMRWAAFQDLDTGTQHLYDFSADTSGIAGGIDVVSDLDPYVVVNSDDYGVVWSGYEEENIFYYSTPRLEDIEGRPHRGGKLFHLNLDLGYVSQSLARRFIPLSRYKDRTLVGLGIGTGSLSH